MRHCSLAVAVAARRSLLAVGCSVRVGCELRATRALWVAVHCAVINILLLLICCAAAAVAAVRVLPGNSAAGGV